MAAITPTPRPFALAALHEYRFELDPDESISIRLVEGTAELFGMELTTGQDYPFGDECRGAIFSWHGAKIEMSRPSTEYVAEETPLPSWLALHLALEKLRLSSVPPSHFRPSVAPPPSLRNRHLQPGEEGYEDVPGPRVMVVGNEGEGKSTLVKTLLNWTIKSSRTRKDGPGTLLINLDPADGGCTVPGTFSISPVATSIPTTTPVLPFGSTPTSGPPVPFQPSAAKTAAASDDADDAAPAQKWSAPPNPSLYSPLLNPLTFSYGHLSLSRNPVLAEHVIKRMGESLMRRVDEGAESAVWRNGWIVDTSGEMVGKERRGLIKEAVRAFGITILVVLGSEKLQLEMTKFMSTNKTVKVVRVPTSGGASDLEIPYRRRLQASQVRSYFYGGPALSQGQLSPFTIVVKFEDLKIYRVGSEAMVPSSALPIGAVRTVRDTSLVRIDPEDPRSLSELINAVLAIPQSTWSGRKKRGGTAGSGVKDEEEDAEEEEASPEEEEVAIGPVLGFVHLASMDVKAKKYTILSPLPGRLTRSIALVGSCEWMDT